MAKKEDLTKAKNAKQDEFYTSLSDIEVELKHYKYHFEGKTVLCNCDDPYESNFFKYFAMNFNFLGLKKLIATCYDGSPVAGTQLSLFDIFEEKEKRAFKVEITEINDMNNDGVIDLFDVELLLKQEGVVQLLNGNGDFRSPECIKLLEEADIVVTNPPFSLFREYVTQLVEYNKKFLIIGNQNAITYKEIFPLIKEDKLWLGLTMNGSNRYFRVPDDYPLTESTGKIVNGIKYAFVKSVVWFTNMETQKRNEEVVLYKHYNNDEYPNYDNYDGINVDNYSNIPCDYFGVIGVPITFLHKYCPKQFEILGIAKSPLGNALRTKIYSKQIQHAKNGSTSFVSKLNDCPSILVETPPVDEVYYEVDGKYYISKYARLLIRRVNQC